MAGLKDYQWCGHGAAVSGTPDALLCRDELLSYFGSEEKLAVEKYVRTVAEKAGDMRRPDLKGGGLRRSLGGEVSMPKVFGAEANAISDQRVLGNSWFVESVLRAANESLEKARKSRSEVLAEVEKLTGIAREDLFRHSHEQAPSRARAVYCYLCKSEAGVTGSELMRELSLSSGAVSKLVAKGIKLTAELGR